MEFEKEYRTYKVLGVYGSCTDDAETFFTVPKESLTLDLQGIIGERHYGYELISGPRQVAQYQRGTLIRNNRQWTAISPRDIETIQDNLEIQKGLTPELLGINLLLDGQGRLSELSPMTYLMFSKEDHPFSKGEEAVTLVVYAQVSPCNKAGRAISTSLGEASIAQDFKHKARGYRGITGWVEKGGLIEPGYNCFALTPTGVE